MASAVDAEVDHDSLLTQFQNLTGASHNEAEQYLQTNQWDLSSAAAEYYTSLEEAANAPDSLQTETATAPVLGYTGPRTLAGDPAPQPIPTTSSMAPPTSSGLAPKKKFATLGDLGGGSSAHTGHSHDDDDSDDSEDQDLFAGGEKSALAVQNPDDLKRKILEKARKNAPRPSGSAPTPTNTRFTGVARTLGGDDTPSQTIPDPTASQPAFTPPVERILHFWDDGFSIDDGDLYRIDDPANAATLAMIRQGRAPLAIMNVERNQEVDVKLETHQGKYVPQPKKYKPFGGGGQRLGSPTPGISGSSTGTTAISQNTPIEALASSTPFEPAPSIDIDDSQPTISLQIRLGDGTRLSSRFNTTHTIGDVYAFINASSPGGGERSWVLMTTFPSKELSDKAQILGDLPEFKRGGVVIQKWQR